MKRGEIYYIESTYRETGSEQRGGRPAVIPFFITHALIQAVKGNREEGLFFSGASVGLLDRMCSVRELMEELTREWRALA